MNFNTTVFWMNIQQSSPEVFYSIFCYTHINMKGTIYTDGSSRGNPGPGGWGVIYFDDEVAHEKGGHHDDTTNNRMEMQALIEGLLDVEDHVRHLTICADSEYVIKGATLWMKGWKKNGWKTAAKKEVLNQDLWKNIDALYEELLFRKVVVEWKHVRGHAGIELNERADVIATSYADKKEIALFRGEKGKYAHFLGQ